MDKSDTAIEMIAKELECNPAIHDKVIADMMIDPEFTIVCTMIRHGAAMKDIRFNGLYDKHLRKYAIDEYHDRCNDAAQVEIDKKIWCAMCGKHGDHSSAQCGQMNMNKP